MKVLLRSPTPVGASLPKDQAIAFLSRLRKLKSEIDDYGIASANFMNDTKRHFTNVCATFSKTAGPAELGVAEGVATFANATGVMRAAMPDLDYKYA